MVRIYLPEGSACSTSAGRQQLVYTRMSLKSELCDRLSNPNFLILVAGSGAGIVKIWDLSALLGATTQVSTVLCVLYVLLLITHLRGS